MRVLKILVFGLLILFGTDTNAQVKIRLFSNQMTGSSVFTVTKGKYEINTFNGIPVFVNSGEPVVITRYEGRLAVKSRGKTGLVCDSLVFSGKTGDDSFALRISGQNTVRQFYSGDLHCYPDLGTLVLVNICDIEKYISGVVRAEGGTRNHEEYFKTQAVIARTYMYRYFDKHLADRYNVCDNTHCQVFNGISLDALVKQAVLATKGLVILAPDSTLIISAFHSNCGGETSSSEDVWLTSQPYLKSVVDPYCNKSRNAKWEKIISLNDWIKMIKKSGYTGQTDNPAAFSFVQKSRLTEYRTGTFTMPFKTIRAELNLRSAFFSVVADGESLLIRGKGYGHGVGLCQEGAMEMAKKGFSYQQIIDFYYSGVFVSDIKNAVILSPGNASWMH